MPVSDSATADDPRAAVVQTGRLDRLWTAALEIERIGLEIGPRGPDPAALGGDATSDSYRRELIRHYDERRRSFPALLLFPWVR